MYFGKKSDGTLYWGDDTSQIEGTPKNISTPEWMKFIDSCNSNGKTVGIDDDGNPIAVTPPEPTYTDEELATMARSKRDSLINAIQWRVQRYEEQIAAGITTTDSESNYKAILEYIQELRDVPEQTGFPKNITWPELSILHKN